LNEIFAVARLLGNHWQRQLDPRVVGEPRFQFHKNERRRLEAIFWAGFNEEDRIAARVDKAVSKIESIAKKAAQKS
jgi:hypothetical protein